MNSILYDYFLPRGISLLMIVIVGYFIFKKEISKWVLILYIPISAFSIVLTFSGPTIFKNIEVFEKLNALKPEDVLQINVFEQSLTGDVYEAIPYSSFVIRDRTKIEFIVNELKQNERNSENKGHYEKLHGMYIMLRDESKIDFSVINSTEGIYVQLLNEHHGKYYNIGSYKNNDLLKIFD